MTFLSSSFRIVKSFLPMDGPGFEGADALGVARILAAAIQKAEIGLVFSNTIPWIARLLITDFVLAFEVASVMLLAAIIGALALIREG